ncbi:MAG: DUF4350 domain-containing protein [Flavobacteriaceae bacterium]
MLDKRSRNIVIALGVVILGILITEVVRPRPLDWRPNYTISGKVPLGCYVLFEELENLLDAPVEEVTKDPYEFLTEGTYKQNSTYMLINNWYYLDESQVEALYQYVSEGNTVFLSAHQFGNFLSDTLKTEVQTNYDLLEERVSPQFLNPVFSKDTAIVYEKAVRKSYFTKLDTLHAKALGYFELEGKEPLSELNFISVSVGKGQFLMHTLPEAFSNYYLLNHNESYAARLLSYVDTEQVYWDSYVKSGKKVVTSPLRFILQEPALKWAFYTALVGLLVFLLFTAKREQRIIKVIKPLENSSVEFTKTIGHLYLQHKDYTDIIAKKINYFLDGIRTQYFLDTQKLDEEFVRKLAMKSGKSLEKSKTLIELICRLKEKTWHSENDLMLLDKTIDEFKY